VRHNAAAALAALALLAGCGDESEPASSAPETTSAETPAEAEEEAAGEEPEIAGETAERRPPTVEETIELVLTRATTPADICDTRVTEDYVRTAYGAREGCVAAQRPGALADSIQIQEVEEAGDSASAVVIPEGGPYDGVEVQVELVREDTVWRVDSLLADVPAGP
jgi:hypothetical protein